MNDVIRALEELDRQQRAMWEKISQRKTRAGQGRRSDEYRARNRERMRAKRLGSPELRAEERWYSRCYHVVNREDIRHRQTWRRAEKRFEREVPDPLERERMRRETQELYERNMRDGFSWIVTGVRR